MTAKMRVRWHATRGYCVAVGWANADRAAETIAVQFAADLNRVNKVFPALTRRRLFPLSDAPATSTPGSRNHAK